jgi:hypothetical protein
MKVGDLVIAPVWGEYSEHASYVGIITGIYGHKVDVSGGPCGTEVWDKSDLNALCSQSGFGLVNESR